MSEKLPSIDDFYEELPSVDEVIKENKLPSVNDYIENPDESDEIESEKEEVEAPGTPCSVEESQDLTEIVRLINDVRKDIPDIPEIKYYDDELEKLSEQVELVRDSIPEIPEIKYYDEEIASLREEIDRNAADIPEIKYYDEQVDDLEKKIKVIKEDIVNLPEPKYYEEDLESLKEDILTVKESIPVFPKWVNEVNEVPDFSWIGKTFGVIDSDFVKVNDGLDSIRGRIDQEIQEISENFDLKDFENKVEFKKVTDNLKETKENIYKELREAALKIHETKHSFKNDDRLLKKQILSKYNVLKQRVEEEVKEFNRKNDATKDLYGGYFEGLTQEIANLPKVKYYDEDIEKLSGDVKNLKSLYLIVEELKEKQKAFKKEFNEVKDLQEGLLNEPNDEAQSVDGTNDPLTPLDKQFPNLKSLADHYRLFISRTQQQIATIGGGGAGYINDLSDVEVGNTPTTGEVLIYNGTNWVGIGSTLLDSSSTLHEALLQGNVSGIGMSVGVITATNGYFSGIVTAAQLNYDVVTDIYSTGIVTATKGIQQTGNEGLHVTAGVSTFVGLSSFQGGVNVKAGSATTSLIVEGDARITGILTIGTGSVTIEGTTNKVKIGTGVTLTSTGDSDFVGVVTAKGFVVGSAATISNNGNISCGIITATSFTVAGTSLAETIADTVGGMVSSNTESGITVAYQDADNTLDFTVGTLNQDTTGNAATATALETARNIGGVSFDGSANINLPGVNEAGNQNTSGTSAGLTGNPTITVTKVNVGTAATIAANGNATFSGIVTAYKFAGDGSGLSNVGMDTSNVSGSTLNIAGVTTSTGGIYVGTAASIFANGNVTAGIITATSFVGPLTGNVTGNTSGSSGSCTGNAAGLTGTPDITVGDVVAASLDISGDADIDGTLEADAITVNGTALDTHIAGVTVTTATNATNITAADESSDTTCFPLFVTAATGNLPPKTGSNLSFNSSSGALTATSFSGDGSNLTGTGPQEADTSVSSTSATTVLSVAHASYRGSFVKVLITQGSAYQMGNYTIIHDGTTASIIEESAIATGSMLGTFSATISGSNLLMQVTMGSSSSATVTVKADNITV